MKKMFAVTLLALLLVFLTACNTPPRTEQPHHPLEMLTRTVVVDGKITLESGAAIEVATCDPANYYRALDRETVIFATYKEGEINVFYDNSYTPDFSGYESVRCWKVVSMSPDYTITNELVQEMVSQAKPLTDRNILLFQGDGVPNK